MPSIWRVENFSRGLHTKPARAEGGESYAADIENLRVDGDGFLRLRSNFRTVEPGGADITGVAVSEKHLFILRADGKLYIRSITQGLTTETEVPGVANMRGRISVVSRFSDYVVITSEGTDSGYWIDLRPGRPLRANDFGIDPPGTDDFQVVSILPQGTRSTALTAYAISYVRQFEAGIAGVQPDDLFNGAESNLSPPKPFFTAFVPQTGRPPVSVTSVSGEWTWQGATNDNVIIEGGVTYNGISGELLISYIDRNEADRTELLRNLARRLTFREIRMESGGSTFLIARVRGFSIEADGIRLRIGDNIPDSPGLGNAVNFSVLTGLTDPLFIPDANSEPYYPAEIAGVQYPADEQITGINVYRSPFFREESHNFLRLKTLIDNDDPQLDLATLPFRKIAYVPRSDRNRFFDGVIRVPTDTEMSDAEDGRYRPYTTRDTTNLASRNFYAWEEQEILNPNQNERLPPEVSQIHYHAGRIFAPVGDRLIYSDFDGTISKLWAFPKRNEIRRTRPGRVDFCASHREVLLFGGHDGLYRLTGLDPLDFDSDEISGVGPLDGYSWGTLKNSLGFVGRRGLYLTDASSVDSLSDEVLNGFFDAKVVQRGAVLFFEDDTMLFFVRLQSMDGREIADSFFLFDDRHWVRWSGETATQFASNAGQFYVAGAANLKQIQWQTGENMDVDLSWAWESNLIHGQAQGVSNTTKRFAELLVSAVEGIDITLKTWVDTQRNPAERKFATRDDTYFQRIPIERIGKRLRFRLEGTGPVEIRGLQIEGEV